MNDFVFELNMKVRDYECDFQGIVNNANYVHYLEHTRHEFFAAKSISITHLHTLGIDPVVSRISISYKNSLRSGDEFVSKFFICKEGVRFVFHQSIFKQADNSLCISAEVETVCLISGKLSRTSLFDEILKPYIKE